MKNLFSLQKYEQRAQLQLHIAKSIISFLL